MPLYVTFLLFVFSVTAPSNYATDKTSAVTPFKLANEYHTVAFIAHNEKAGAAFDDLKTGDEIVLVYADHNQVYKVSTLAKYRAMSPLSVYSNFVPDGGSNKLSAADLFLLMYDAKDGRLVLQTCYDGSNGRLFVIAYPKK